VFRDIGPESFSKFSTFLEILSLMIRQWFHIILMLLAGQVAAQGPAMVAPTPEPFSLLEKGAIQVWTDTSGEAALDHSRQQSYRPIDSPLVRLIYPQALWARIYLAPGEDPMEKWLHFAGNYQDYPWLNDIGQIDVWFVRGDSVIRHDQTGYYVPASQRALPLRRAVQAVPIPRVRKDTLTVYLRTVNLEANNPLFWKPMIRPANKKAGYTHDKNKLVVYGSFLAFQVVAWFVLAFWFFIRESSFLYFGLFCIIFSGHYLFLDPVSTVGDHLFPENPYWCQVIFDLCGSGGVLFMLFFGRAFSESKARFPFWYKYLTITIGISVVLLVIEVAQMLQPPFRFIPLASFGILILIIPVAIRFVTSGWYGAQFFGVGIMTLMGFGVIGQLWNAGIIQLPFNPWPVGQLGLLLIYGVGLGYRLWQGEKEKSEALRIQELDAIKSRFFANISHEFRTPLTLIAGPVGQALERMPASEDPEEANDIPVPGRHLQLIQRNTHRLQALVDQLLTLSRLENGEPDWRWQTGGLITYLRTLAVSFESLAERRHIQYEIHLPAEPDRAQFDPDKWEKIVTNLLSNAFKFTPDHGVIRVQASDTGESIRLEISDSGPGIPAGAIGQIFDRFYQVEGTEAQGTGIGLALVKELVDTYGGQISVQSQTGNGTTFRIVLPYRSEDLPAGEFLNEKPKTTIPLLSNGQSEEVPAAGDPDQPLILVVEDHPELRQYIGSQLAGGYRVVLAADGQEGTKKALAMVPDLIISDIMMPRRNGLELCQTLKADPRTSHIPIILLTAKAGQEPKIQGLETGADDYLTKPFHGRELRIRMQNLIDQRERLRKHFAEASVGLPAKTGLKSLDERFMQDVLRVIEENLDNEFFTVEELAENVGFSRSQLNRKIKALTDRTTNQFIRSCRLQRAKELLEQGTGSVSEIAYQVGYSNLSYFARSYKSQFGRLPSDVLR
jgi:signal transduction histidine kinase/DNA-binding response OmpR family regulator